MPPNPPTSSPVPILHNRTNIIETPIQTKLSFALPTPPHDNQRVAAPQHTRRKKRKVTFGSHCNDHSDSESDSDGEMEGVLGTSNGVGRYIPFHITAPRAAMGIPGRIRQIAPSTRAILQSFISSHKSDVFKCESSDVNAYLTPPYASSYTHSAKRGGKPLLAVATEQGTVHILDTCKKSDWDPEPPRTTLEIHNNGIFDAKWSSDDTLLATCSGDQSTRITSLSTETVTYVLRGHKSTVKCVAWDRSHTELLSTGGRDGSICIWDLRSPGNKDEDESIHLNPVISIPGAHEDVNVKRGRRGKNVPAPKSVTSLLYPEIGPYGLISSGSSDGILRYWDLRLPRTQITSRSTKPKLPINLYSSPIDPTCLHSSRRSRGIIRLTEGSGPTAGLIFGLGADSRVHTYSLPSLQVLPIGYAHEKMQTNSFYVGLSLSPCGRWLAAGSGGIGTGTHGSAFLFDVTNAAKPGYAYPAVGVQLQAQQGEVGAVDWAHDMLASCADDGTVRVWRPDIENYRSSVERPDDARWDWSWAT